MNPESENDSLDDALRSRRVMAPPSAFTGAVLARIKADRRRSRVADLLAEYGVRGGLALAALGVSLVVDLNGGGAALAAALAGPEGATAVAVTAICLAWVLAQRDQEGAF